LFVGGLECVSQKFEPMFDFGQFSILKKNLPLPQKKAMLKPAAGLIAMHI
jgi:hypothetical protein